MYTLILAGGSGTRLWPLSRRETPKQFLKLFGEQTLLEDTVLRASEVSPPGSVHVVSGGDWRALVEHQARNVWPQGDLQVIAEPCGRNTAPAVALGIAWLLENGASVDDVVMVCPSDHVITNTSVFREAVEKAARAAEAGWITTFGVTPAGPETGYGYIRAARQESGVRSQETEAGNRRKEAGGRKGIRSSESSIVNREPEGPKLFHPRRSTRSEAAGWIAEDTEISKTKCLLEKQEQNLPLTDSPFSSLPPGVFAVECFVEKPDLDTAKSYIAEGGYFWNSGMFVFRIGDMVEAMKRHVPEVGLALEQGFDHLSAIFESLPNISLDYAVMEKLKYAAVVPLDAGW